MFQRKDDNILKFAFGEMDSVESQAFDASLLSNPQNLEEVNALRTMREDLASLRDIPEMQFSKERLRDAILGQGIQPAKPRLSWINWVLAPTSLACVLALGFVLMRGTGDRPTGYVGDQMTVANTSKPQPKFELTTPTKDVSTKSFNNENPLVAMKAPKNDEIADVAKPTRKREAVGGTKRSVRRVRRAEVLVATRSGEPAKSETRETQTTMTYDSSALKATRAAITPSESIELEPPIVIIDASQDSGAGAAVATEVANPTNVVIGG
jgi:hypothetical protein